MTAQNSEFYPKHWKNPDILILENWKKYWKSRGNLPARKVKSLEIWCHALNKKSLETFVGSKKKEPWVSYLYILTTGPGMGPRRVRGGKAAPNLQSEEDFPTLGCEGPIIDSAW